MRPVLVAALLLAALAAGGCGLGAGTGTGGVNLVVTRDFGDARVGGVRADRVPGSETVMRFLARSFSVQTRYGGGFVQAIDGRPAGAGAAAGSTGSTTSTASRPRKGAAASALHAGDRVWWDRHDWSAAQRVPAVVGSFPEPFLHGREGQRLPIRIDCASGAAAAVRRGRARALRAAGVPRRAGGAGHDVDADKTLRVLVGPVERGCARPAARQIEARPRGERRLRALRRRREAARAPGRGRARARRTLAAGAGLVAATRLGDRAADLGGRRHRRRRRRRRPRERSPSRPR